MGCQWELDVFLVAGRRFLSVYLDCSLEAVNAQMFANVIKNAFAAETVRSERRPLWQKEVTEQWWSVDGPSVIGVQSKLS